MSEIIPAILPSSYHELEEKLGLIAGAAKTAQIDICDGGFVPNRTWPYLKAHQDDMFFDEIVAQDKALPGWEDTDFEFDLMVKKPHEKIPDFISAGATRIVVHKASCAEGELEDIIRDFGKHSEELGPFDIELGLAIANSSVVADIAAYVENIHFVQVMGIDHSGFQGQAFNPRTIECVKALRAAYPELIISIDGGVNLENGGELLDAGADRLVVGSGIFHNDTVLENLSDFQNL